MTAKIINNNTIHVYDLSQFDTDAIMHSGQVFRYFKTDTGYQLISGKHFAEIIPQRDKVIIKCDDSSYWYNYFDLPTDYNEIKKELGVFEQLLPAIKLGGGIRILRGEFHEIVISFIISANNNIKRFTKTLNLLAEQYGDKLSNRLCAFPTLDQLTKVTAEDFKKLGCGYRSSYLVKAVKQLKEIDIELLRKMPTAELTKTLLQIQGVGKKVCACVELFAGDLHRLEVCPVDTWIQKALEQLGETDKTAILNHKYAGVAQQYIFYYLQHLRKKL